MKHVSEDALTLIYFDEAVPLRAERLHLAECLECQVRLERLSRFLDTLRAVPVPEKGPEWEQRVWARISADARVHLGRGKRRRLRYWLLAPALAALVLVAFLAGMYTQRRALPGTSPRARERVLLIALGNHMERSQIILAELENAPEGRGADISAQRQLATNLLDENRLLRLTALRAGDTGDAAVLDQLERLLVDLTHAPGALSSGELEEFRDRIKDQGLLFKVRVIGMNSKEKGMKL